MKDYSSEEIQNISANFRNVARRLSRTDYSQCDANLKRFMNVINSQELIKDFIEQHNTFEFDIEKIIQERDWISPFEISPVMDEEISLEYEMLKYSLENYEGDFTRLYGTHVYTSTKSTTNDEMRKFIEHIIDPLIDFISEHLRMCYDKKVHEEEKNGPNIPSGITANYSTVVVANNIEGNISNSVTISEDVKNDAIDLINSIKEVVSVDENEAKDDILEVLKQIESDINENNKPKKGFLVALKSICGGSAAVITLINSLMKLFGFV
jgi:hypothetical protein